MTPPKDIYQKDLEQILTKYSDKKAEPIANTYMQSKPQLNYSILHRTGRKEPATKAIYLTPSIAYTFASALLQP